MAMNRETRITKITEVMNNPDSRCASKRILWKEEREEMDVYKIPLIYLIYNRENGRILSKIKSFEKHKGRLPIEEEEKIIADFLWASYPARNKNTMEHLKNHRQLEPGIVTEDGVIIDGNRRAMLLRKLGSEYFEAIVLPVRSDDSEHKKEINRLETFYQMGSDDKLPYPAIDKRMKARELKIKGFTVKEIAKEWGEKEEDIEKSLNMMELMDDYLEYHGYDGIYTLLEKRDDQFERLSRWLNAFYFGHGGKQDSKSPSTKAFDGYTNDDVDDLKSIAFDHIRARYDGSKFRHLGQGLREQHLFGNRKIWESFSDNHYKSMQPILDEEGKPDLSTDDLTKALESRDEEFKVKAEDLLDDNYNAHMQRVYQQKYEDKPAKVFDRVLVSIEDISNNENIQEPEALDKVKEIREITENILTRASPYLLLQEALRILSSIEVSQYDGKDKADVIRCVTDINKIAYQLQKQIKKIPNR